MRTGSYRLVFAVTGLFACTTVTATKVALGQSAINLVAPTVISLHVHSELKDTDFVEPLVCALRRVLVAAVEARTISLSLSPDMLATPTQFDAIKVGQKFGRATAPASASTFRYFLMPHLMKSKEFSNPGSMWFGKGSMPYHIGVVTIARLGESIDPNLSRFERAELIARRTYKVLIRGIVEATGMSVDRSSCILTYARTLEDLDRKSMEFCPQDRATLVKARVLKAVESDGCFYVSEGRQTQSVAEMLK